MDKVSNEMKLFTEYVDCLGCVNNRGGRICEATRVERALVKGTYGCGKPVAVTTNG